MIHTPTQFVEANGIRFAHRRFGKPDGVPLVFNLHFTGTMDHWDPAVTDGLARARRVVLFNNAGVLSSSGEVPTSFAKITAKPAKTTISAGPTPPLPSRTRAARPTARTAAKGIIAAIGVATPNMIG